MLPRACRLLRELLSPRYNLPRHPTHPLGEEPLIPSRTARIVRRSLWIFLTVALLAAIGWGVVAVLHRPPAVEVAETRREDVRRVLAVTGRIRPRQVNQVRPLAPGRLTSLPLEVGDPVARGDLLARVDDREARAAVAQARAALRAQTHDLDQARRDLARSESLFADGLIPAGQLEQSRLTVARGEEEVERLREALRQTRVRLDDYVLRSPLAGRVLRRPVDPGQIVDTSTVLYEIATEGAPWVEAQVDEIYLSELTEGMPAKVAPPGRRDRVWDAKVVWIGDRVDPDTGSATVRMAFDDTPDDETPNGEVPDLPSGMSMDVNLQVAEHRDAVTVPRAAVVDPGGEAWVLTVEREGERWLTRRRAVEVIDWPAERVVALSGLDGGERVVLSPRAVPAGIEVRILPSERPDDRSFDRHGEPEAP